MFNGSQLVNTGQLSANKRKTKHRQNCTPKKTDPETENKKKKRVCQYIQGETCGRSLIQPSHIWMIQGRPTSLPPGELLVAYRGPPQLTTQAKTHKDKKMRVT